MFHSLIFIHGAFSLRLLLDNKFILSLRLEWSPERRWKEIGGKKYSEWYEQCDVFEGDISRMRMGLRDQRSGRAG